MTTYDQPTKDTVRRRSLAAAVTSLTTARTESCCVRPTYVREAQDQLRRQGGDDRRHVERLGREAIRAWEAFHRSEVGARRPDELTVAYLGGPDPGTDFDVLVDLGVHPHNVWAFESDARTYEQARAAVASRPFARMKLIHGSLEEFFATVPRTFDIVYLDACAPLPSASQRTLRTMATMMRHQRLASPGVLITNFAEPGLASAEDLDAYERLIAAYLYPKGFLEGIDGRSSGMIEGASCHGDDLGAFHGRVHRDLDYFYSQFVTRQIMDLGAVVVPALRAANGAQWRRLFAMTPTELRAACLAEDEDLYICDSEHFPLTACLDTLSEGPASQETGWTQGLPRLQKLGAILSNEWDGVTPLGYKAADCVRAVEASRIQTGTGWTPTLQEAVRRSLAPGMFQFCDVPSNTLVLDPLLGQIGYPYHCAPNTVQRWTYRAKKTRMFLDLFVFDECRYIYDWLPSLQLLDRNFVDTEQQLVFRLALDGVAKARRWYNSDTFFGTAVIDQGVAGFEAAELAPRQHISATSEAATEAKEGA